MGLVVNVLKSKPKVAIVLPTIYEFTSEFKDRLESLTYPNRELFLETSVGKCDKNHRNKHINHFQRCAWARNRARWRALLSNPDYILYIDDDVYFPSNVIEELMEMNQPVSAAWVPAKNEKQGTWVAAQCKIDEPNTFIYPTRPMIEPEQKTPFMSVITPVDCSLWRAEVSERIRFRTDFQKRFFKHNNQRYSFAGECSCAGFDLREMGILCAMSTRVVCEHRREENPKRRVD